MTVAAMIALALLLAAAVHTDVRARRIPNWLVLAGLLTAAVMHAAAWLAGQTALAGPAAWAPATGLLAGFGGLLPLYLIRACGAGDVKLMAMIGAFVGPGAAATTVLYTLLAGGLLALAFMLGRGVAAQTLANLRFLLTDWTLRVQTGQGARLAPLQTTAARLPYAVAIALGTAAALIWPLGGP